jgi:hypothetical protein
MINEPQLFFRISSCTTVAEQDTTLLKIPSQTQLLLNQRYEVLPEVIRDTLWAHRQICGFARFAPPATLGRSAGCAAASQNGITVR